MAENKDEKSGKDSDVKKDDASEGSPYHTSYVPWTPNSRNPGPGSKVVAIGIVALLLLIVVGGVLAAMIINVPAGHKAVVVSGFNIGKQFDEGWNLKNPLSGVEFIRYNTQEQSYVGADQASDAEGSIMTITNDNVEVFVDMTIVYHITPSEVSTLRLENGNDWRVVLIDPVARSVPRDVAAHFSVFEIAGTKRSQLGLAIEENITIELAKKNIIVENFALRDIRLPTKIQDAIEDKKAAEQDVQTASYKLQEEVIFAQQKVVNARADYNVTVIQAEARNQAVSIVMEQFNKTYGLEEYYNSTNVSMAYNPYAPTEYYLMWLYIQALTDPNSNIEYILLPAEGGFPVILDLTGSGNQTAG